MENESWDEIRKYCQPGGGDIRSESLEDKYYYYTENERKRLTLKSNQYKKIEYRDGFDLDDAKVIAVLAPLVYEAKNDKNHRKRIVTYNVPEVYDARNIAVKINSSEQTSITFAMKRNSEGTPPTALNAYNLVYNESAPYVFTFRNDDDAYVLSPSISVTNTDVIFKFDNFNHDYTDLDCFALIYTQSNFAYNLHIHIQYRDNQWVIV